MAKYKTIIKPEVSNDNWQKIRMSEHFEIASEKIRISICSDSYLNQCYARASIYNSNEKKWNRLASIPSSNMETGSGLYSTRMTDKLFIDKCNGDRRTLLTKVCILLDA